MDGLHSLNLTRIFAPLSRYLVAFILAEDERQMDHPQVVVMAKPPRAFASRRRGEAAGVGTWRMGARLARRKSRIFHIVTCSEQRNKES